MKKYICIKTIKLPYFDEQMQPTDDYGEVQKQSTWVLSNSISESDIKLDKVGGFSDFEFIDITHENFKSNFILLR